MSATFYGIQAGRASAAKNSGPLTEQASVNINVAYDITDGEERNAARGLFGGSVDNPTLSIKEGEGVWKWKTPAMPVDVATCASETYGFAVFNGIGDVSQRTDPSEFYEEIEFLGFCKANVEATGIGENESSESFAVQIGGTWSVPNTGPMAFRAGQLIMAIPPDPNEDLSGVAMRESHHNGNMPAERYITRLVPFVHGRDEFTLNALRKCVATTIRRGEHSQSMYDHVTSTGVPKAAAELIKALKIATFIGAGIAQKFGMNDLDTLANNLGLDGKNPDNPDDADALQLSLILAMLGVAPTADDQNSGAVSLFDGGVTAEKYKPLQRNMVYDLYKSWTAAHYSLRRYIAGQALSDALPGNDMEVFVGGFAL